MVTYLLDQLPNTLKPQNVQADDRQAQNNAGGYSFVLDKWGQLDRFLILGSEGGTYYVNEFDLTKKNLKNVKECLAEDPQRFLAHVVDVSVRGRAVKNEPALFALALASADSRPHVRAQALERLTAVARTGTHLYHFVAYIDDLRGWGSGLRKGVSQWFDNKTVEELAFQYIKYQQRDGWSMADVMRKAHPTAYSTPRINLYRFIRGVKPTIYPDMDGKELRQLAVVEELKSLGSQHGESRIRQQVINAIQEFKLPREAIPTEFLNYPDVWEALLYNNMPMNALVRNIRNLRKHGVLAPMSAAEQYVIARLSSREEIKRSRIHPFRFLQAMVQNDFLTIEHDFRTYDIKQTATAGFARAMSSAFYHAFENVVPSNKRTMLALDVSGSMYASGYFGQSTSGQIVPALGAAAMALVTARVEPSVVVTTFAEKFGPVKLSAYGDLVDAFRSLYGKFNGFGGTDCALPMLWANENNVPIDTFVVYTDNETWAGRIHPFQALRTYRAKMGIPAKLIVVGMTATEFSIADPSDNGMLDVVGFDTATPELISRFSAGDI